MEGIGHPLAFGACSVILGLAGLHVGFDASGATALWQSLPARFQPELSDSSHKVASVFPALTAALMCLQLGDLLGAQAAYAHAGPPRSWAPNPALLLSCWAHGLPVAIGLGRGDDMSSLLVSLSPSAANTSRTVPVSASTWGRSNCNSVRRLLRSADSMLPWSTCGPR